MSNLKRLRDLKEKDQTILSVVAIPESMLIVLTSGYVDGVLFYHTHRYSSLSNDWYGENVVWYHSEPTPPSETMYPFLSLLTQFTKQFYPTKDHINDPARG